MILTDEQRLQICAIIRTLGDPEFSAEELDALYSKTWNLEEFQYRSIAPIPSQPEEQALEELDDEDLLGELFTHLEVNGRDAEQFMDDHELWPSE